MSGPDRDPHAQDNVAQPDQGRFFAGDSIAEDSTVPPEGGLISSPVPLGPSSEAGAAPGTGQAAPGVVAPMIDPTALAGLSSTVPDAERAPDRAGMRPDREPASELDRNTR